jgi:hypothetical protein
MPRLPASCGADRTPANRDHYRAPRRYVVTSELALRPARVHRARADDEHRPGVGA